MSPTHGPAPGRPAIDDPMFSAPSITSKDKQILAAWAEVLGTDVLTLRNAMQAVGYSVSSVREHLALLKRGSAD